MNAMLRLVFCFISAFQVHSFNAGSRLKTFVGPKTSSTRLCDVEGSYESNRLNEFDIFDAGLDEHFVLFPSPSYEGAEIVDACMEALLYNENPYKNAGLEVCWNFASDSCRASKGGSFEAFIGFANNPVFSSMVNALSWTLKSTGNLIPKTNTRGEMQTFVIEVENSKGRKRDFVWTLQKERRPPRQNCWLVHECLSRRAAACQQGF